MEIVKVLHCKRKEYDKIFAMGFACGSNKIPNAFFIAYAQIFCHTHHTCYFFFFGQHHTCYLLYMLAIS